MLSRHSPTPNARTEEVFSKEKLGVGQFLIKKYATERLF
jgi:hypothetical protein